jgi:NADH-quinone oxidoreductase subunit C
VTPAEAAARIRESFGVEPTTDGATLSVPLSGEQWQAFGRFAKETLGCWFFSWLTAVDWKEQGFEVLCRVENLDAGLVLLVRTRLAAGEPHCATLVDVWRGANWMERECFDLLGVIFDGHPDLRRILLPDDWEGHPLRKDYAHDMPHPPYR